jgi:hypothetical protein
MSGKGEIVAFDRSKLKSDPQKIEDMLKRHEELMRVTRQKVDDCKKASAEFRAARRELRDAGYLR